VVISNYILFQNKRICFACGADEVLLAGFLELMLADMTLFNMMLL
jgi:hypothetical protein